jgi:hypothetical protein
VTIDVVFPFYRFARRGDVFHLEARSFIVVVGRGGHCSILSNIVCSAHQLSSWLLGPRTMIAINVYTAHIAGRANKNVQEHHLSPRIPVSPAWSFITRQLMLHHRSSRACPSKREQPRNNPFSGRRINICISCVVEKDADADEMLDRVTNYVSSSIILRLPSTCTGREHSLFAAGRTASLYTWLYARLTCIKLGITSISFSTWEAQSKTVFSQSWKSCWAFNDMIKINEPGYNRGFQEIITSLFIG